MKNIKRSLALVAGAAGLALAVGSFGPAAEAVANPCSQSATTPVSSCNLRAAENPCAAKPADPRVSAGNPCNPRVAKPAENTDGKEATKRWNPCSRRSR